MNGLLTDNEGLHCPLIKQFTLNQSNGEKCVDMEKVPKDGVMRKQRVNVN